MTMSLQDAEKDKERPLTSGDGTELSGMDTTDTTGDTDLLSLLVFKMEEPSPDIDMQAWIQWFDRLGEYVDIFT